MSEKLLITMPDDLAKELRETIPKGEVSAFVVVQVKRGLEEKSLRSMDDAVAHIVNNDRNLLDRLGNVQ